MRISATLFSWSATASPAWEVVEVDHDPEDDFQVLQWQLLSLLPQTDVAIDNLILIDCFGREVCEHGDLVEQDGRTDLWCVAVGRDGVLPFCSTSIVDQLLIQPTSSPYDLELSLCEHCSTLLASGTASTSVSVTTSIEMAVALQPRACQRDGMITIGLAPDSMLLEKLAWSEGPQTLFAAHPQVALYLEGVLLSRAIVKQRALLASQPLAHSHEERNRFRQRLQGAMRTVNTYEDPRQREVALSYIDFPKLLEYYLEERNKDELRSDGKGPRQPAELVLVALLRWFKGGFFQWFNQPSCPNAEQDKGVAHQMVHSRIDQATGEEQAGWPSRVEVYTCQACQCVSRFPRYNNPAFMIKNSRKGRCGEFANVFGLFCRSLGFDTRYVLDLTDHVWVEVYLPAADNRQRDKVVHLDPCEKALDSPLMYEQGWKKSLTQVLAFSRYGVWDVIRRYTQDVHGVVSRRNSSVLPESLACELVESADHQALQAFLDQRRSTSGNGRDRGSIDWMGALSEGKSYFLAHAFHEDLDEGEVRLRRRTTSRELLQLSAVRRWGASGDLKAEEARGRTSGDIAWRKQRGEIHDAEAAAQDESNGQAECGLQRTCSSTADRETLWDDELWELREALPWAKSPGVAACSLTGEAYEGVLSIVLRLDERLLNKAVVPTTSSSKLMVINRVPWPLRRFGVNVLFVDTRGCVWSCSGDETWDFSELLRSPVDESADRDSDANSLCSAFHASAGVLLLEFQSAQPRGEKEDSTVAASLHFLGLVESCSPLEGPWLAAVACAYGQLSPQPTDRVIVDVQSRCKSVQSGDEARPPSFIGVELGLEVNAESERLSTEHPQQHIPVPHKKEEASEEGEWDWVELRNTCAASFCSYTLDNEGADESQSIRRAMAQCAKDGHMGFSRLQKSESTGAGVVVCPFSASGLPLRSFANCTTYLRRSRLFLSQRQVARVTARQLRLYFHMGGGHHEDTQYFDSSTSLAERLPQRTEPWTELVAYAGSQLVNGVQHSLKRTCEAFTAWQDEPRQHVLRVGEGDRLSRMEVRCGALVDRIEIHTETGSCLQAGGSGGVHSELHWPSEMDFAGFFGGLGGHLHNIGIVLSVHDLYFDHRPPREAGQLHQQLYGSEPTSCPDWSAPLPVTSLAQCALMNDAATTRSGSEPWCQNTLPLLASRLETVRRENPPELARKCLKTIAAYFRNIAEHPTDSKYQRIALHNAVLQSSVLAVRGGLALLCFGPAGFFFSNDMTALVSRFSAYGFLPTALRSSWLRALVKLLEDSSASCN